MDDAALRREVIQLMIQGDIESRRGSDRSPPEIDGFIAAADKISKFIMNGTVPTKPE